MKVAKWGNSLAVRLPKTMVEAHGLREGDDISIEVIGSRALTVGKSPPAQELVARLRKYHGRLPSDFRFGHLGAHERH